MHTSADGRQNLAITAANAYYLRHSQVLGYGIVNWVTKGLFLGKKRISMTPQPDDLFIDNDQWVPSAPQRPDRADLPQHRRPTGRRSSTGRHGVRASSPLLNAVKLEFPFNGEGTTGIYRPDTLTTYVLHAQSMFSFVNHTWSHQNLDYANNESGAPTTAATIRNELTQNDRSPPSPAHRLLQGHDGAARHLGHEHPARPQRHLAQQTVVHLGHPLLDQRHLAAGLEQPDAERRASGRRTRPNLLIIPRHPTNIFYNVSTPAQVVDEYNYYYAPGGRWAFWPSPRTYAQIIDTESDNLLAYMLQGDMDPWMFHSSNWRAYDGVHSVLGDLLTATLHEVHRRSTTCPSRATTSTSSAST